MSFACSLVCACSSLLSNSQSTENEARSCFWMEVKVDASRNYSSCVSWVFFIQHRVLDWSSKWNALKAAETLTRREERSADCAVLCWTWLSSGHDSLLQNGQSVGKSSKCAWKTWTLCLMIFQRHARPTASVHRRRVREGLGQLFGNFSGTLQPVARRLCSCSESCGNALSQRP